jgi:dihydrodipicolinate synthase/N-acetylneuraminate lyase
MTDTRLTPSHYARSVVAVPPVALTPDLRVSVPANRAIMAHAAAGGSATLLYGGNANIYNFGARLFREALDTVYAECPASARILFSIGPDFGRAMDQAEVLRAAGVQNAMLLPMAFPADPRGLAEGCRRIADRLGFPLVLYLKRDGAIAVEDAARLIASGAVVFVKYAVERADPADDAYLDALVAALGTDRIASGMAETPVADHIGRRRLATFTSGGICIAPAAANEILSLHRAGRTAEALAASEPFLAFERVRAKLGGIATLHDAVTLSGIADCGPTLPMLSNLTPAGRAEVAPLVEGLIAAEAAARARLAAAA